MLNESERKPYFYKPYYKNVTFQVCRLDEELLKEQLLDWAQDGRAQSKMTEIYAQDILFKIGGNPAYFIKNKKETKYIDGFLKICDKKYPTSLRCLTSKILYHKSALQGAKRKCTADGLMHSLKKADFTIVCDIRPYGQWTYWVVENEMLITQVNRGLLNRNGHTRKAFKTFLQNNGYITEAA
ncbi:MAG: hypothetical protein DWQ19_10990 [Crenarchaeota archaeon]|nr:MAG: hypothetical protein DWQ19_10990 [Thermoproteota archaeon]